MTNADIVAASNNGVIFDQWVGKEGYPSYRDKWGKFFLLQGEDYDSDTEGFKIYVKDEDLSRVLVDGSLSRALGLMKEKNCLPGKMKLLEGDRLVFYGQGNMVNPDEVMDVLQQFGIGARGPAQDVYQISPGNDGELELSTLTSNDGALGESGHTPIHCKFNKYDPAKFLDNYLQLCLWAGKRPDEPYRTSFVYLIDREEVYVGREAEALGEAKKMTRYPVVYARHRLDVARKD